MILDRCLKTFLVYVYCKAPVLAAADAMSSFGSAAFSTSVPTYTAAAGQTPVDKDKRSDSTLPTKVRQFWTCLNVRMYACMYI